MTIEKKAERLPPYVSYLTWTKLINGLANFLPDVIDSSVYNQLRFSGSDTKKLRTALRYLNLIDENGNVLDKLRDLVRAYRGEGDAKVAVLKDIMHGAYPFLSDGSLNLATATWKQLTDKFEAMGATGDVQRLCISFFLHMATESEMEVSPHLSSRAKSGYGRPSAVRKGRQKRREKAKKSRTTEQEDESQPRNSTSDVGDIFNVDPTVAGILHLLPRKGQKWDSNSKERFKTALNAVLDAVYPDENTNQGEVS
jgi:hypothetical protein